MAELKDILLGMLVLIYGIMFYIVGRTNLLEKFVLKLNKMLADYTKTDDDTRTPKERGADKQKITCLNCKHLMFSDMYGECNKQLKIVNPSDTCEYAEPKERGGE